VSPAWSRTNPKSFIGSPVRSLHSESQTVLNEWIMKFLVIDFRKISNQGKWIRILPTTGPSPTYGCMARSTNHMAHMIWVSIILEVRIKNTISKKIRLLSLEMLKIKTENTKRFMTEVWVAEIVFFASMSSYMKFSII